MKEFKNDVEAIDSLAADFKKLQSEIGKVIIGQDEVVQNVLMSIFADGHSLLVGVPGLAKTLLIKTISDALHLSFKRIQFTPDLMPSDITGSEILDDNRNFKFLKGPVFANIILADEINHTAKNPGRFVGSHAGKNVTIGGHLHKLELPFFVLATQNPIEQEGTYPLPEAQLDRFMFNIILDYPSFDAELNIVKSTTTDSKITLDKIIGAEEIIGYQHLVRRIPITDNVLNYAVSLVSKTRPNTDKADPKANQYLSWGAGPRASQYLVLGAKCHAAIKGKYAPDIEDVKAVALPVLRHRIVRNYKAEADGIGVDDLIKGLL